MFNEEEVRVGEEKRNQVYKESGRHEMDARITRPTIKKAYTLVMSAKKLGLNPGVVMFDYDHTGDAMYFLFQNEENVVIVLCCPSCYLVTYGHKTATEKDAEYLIVSNIRSFLNTLKKKGFDGASEEQLSDLMSLVDEENGPSDEEIKEIEEEEDDNED